MLTSFIEEKENRPYNTFTVITKQSYSKPSPGGGFNGVRLLCSSSQAVFQPMEANLYEQFSCSNE